MRTSITYSSPKVITLFIALTFISCSKDSEDSKITVSTSDFSKTYDENPENGEEIGTISGSTNNGSVSFSLVEESPAGALYLDAATGTLKVADETLFDFETNPIITGTVKVANGDVSKNALITITLNDLGDVYEGTVYLETQEEVNSFGANQYSRINGTLIIGFLEEPDMSNIYDLSPLNSIKKIDYSLFISRNSDLSSTEGLNINEIGRQLAIVENPSLISIVGLNNITSLENGLFIWYNDVLSDFTGLSYLANIKTLVLIGCPLMQNIEWLSNITYIEHDITISSCNSITNINGLRNLKQLSMGNISISSNNLLKNLDGLQNLNALISSLRISSNSSLLNIHGLKNINAFHNLEIRSNEMLQSLEGLEKITNLNYGPFIELNNSLINLQGLNNLSVTGSTIIRNNDNLETLNGLSNLTNAWSIELYINPKLSDFCELQNYLTVNPSAGYSANGNAYNPTKQDIIDGNCSL